MIGTPALLFDLDGTLLRSDELHFALFRDLFASHGRDMDMTFYNENIQGRLNADIFSEFFPGQDAQAMADAKEAAFRDRLGDGVEPMGGVVRLLDRAAANGWKTAVVTNAPRENAEAMLGALRLQERFDTVVIADECAAGKPDPEPYLEALRRLEASPAHAIAFEDSRSGVRSASRAGAATIGVRSSLGDAALRDAGAILTIADFDDAALGPVLVRLEGVTP